jgi:hypothetical protein
VCRCQGITSPHSCSLVKAVVLFTQLLLDNEYAWHNTIYRRLSTPRAWVWIQVRLCRFCGGQIGILIPLIASHSSPSIFRGSNSGGRTKWTQAHPPPQIWREVRRSVCNLSNWKSCKKESVPIEWSCCEVGVSSPSTWYGYSFSRRNSAVTENEILCKQTKPDFESLQQYLHMAVAAAAIELTGNKTEQISLYIWIVLY